MLTREEERVTEGVEVWLVEMAVEDTVVMEEKTPAVQFIGFGLFLG